jgi:putative membrane protein
LAAVADDTRVRDELALQRTQLANERTFLAFVRTAIALVAAGASSIHFLEGVLLDALGWVFIAAGVATMVLGVVRFRRVRSLLADVRPGSLRPDEGGVRP